MAAHLAPVSLVRREGRERRLATRDDVAVHQAYIADIEASATEALAAVDPVPYYVRYGENPSGRG
jgi:hypothetical protein